MGIKTSGFAPSGGFFDGWPSPYTEIVTGAYTAAWVGLATYAVIDALGGASAGATAGGAAVATPTTSTLSAEFVVVGKNVGKAPGGAASIGLAVGSGIQILSAANTPLPKPAVPARSPTPGQAPTGNAKGQSLGRVGPARANPSNLSRTARGVQRLPEHFKKELQPVFEGFINLDEIEVVVVDRFPEDALGKHLGGNRIAIANRAFDDGRAAVLGVTAHEIVHVVQERLLGTEAFHRMLLMEAKTTGALGQYDPVGVPTSFPELRNTNFLSGRTLEGIAARTKELVIESQFLPIR